MITYPNNLKEYKQLRKMYSAGRLCGQDILLAESIISHWRQSKGSIALELLVKMSGKKPYEVARELGIKPRQLSEMITGKNSLKSNMVALCNYFNVNQEIFNYERQTRKISSQR